MVEIAINAIGMNKDRPSSLDLLKELAERVHCAIFFYDPVIKEIFYANPQFEHICQKTFESVRNDPQPLIDLIYSEDKEFVFEAVDSFRKESLTEKEIEFRAVVPEFDLRWISMKLYFINQSSQKHIIAGIAEDITETKNHENNLKKFAAKKDSVLEILSHDLAAPFNNIKGIANMLAKKVTHYNDPDIESLVDIISNTSTRSIRLIREFVKQEFLESVHESLIKKRVDIVGLIKNIVDQYKNSEKDIKKVFDLESTSEVIQVAVDEYKFAQVINNLISNAIKFTHDDGKISIRIEEKKDTVLVTVEDDGIGIPENRQEGLFEKFTKARRPGIKGEPSVGLGMSIIKTIVEWHKGKIWFKSVENEGSSFYIDLPKE